MHAVGLTHSKLMQVVFDCSVSFHVFSPRVLAAKASATKSQRQKQARGYYGTKRPLWAHFAKTW